MHLWKLKGCSDSPPRIELIIAFVRFLLIIQFTGENDADIMHNSAMINLNIAEWAVKYKAKKVFYSSSACIYPKYNQMIL